MRTCKSTLALLAGLLALTMGPLAAAAPSHCPQHYAAGAAPDVDDPRTGAPLRELCSEAYGVFHSGYTRTPLWSAEHLTKAHLDEERGLRRENVFHPDDRLPEPERAELDDYARSGFDRGHMTPSGDAWDMTAQHETFALSNMIPQNQDNNRGLHEGIESAVRNMAEDRGELYVITGPIFDPQHIERLHGRVAIPRWIFKLVYDPRAGAAAAYLENNAAGMEYHTVSVEELDKMTGIHFLPGVHHPALLSLPAPTPHGYNHEESSGKSGEHRRRESWNQSMGTTREVLSATRLAMHLIRW